MDTPDTYIRARIDTKTKQYATDALEAMGLSVSDAIRLLMVRVAVERRLPFDLRVPVAAKANPAAMDNSPGDAAEYVDQRHEGLLCVNTEFTLPEEFEEKREHGSADPSAGKSKSLRVRVTERLYKAIIDGELLLGQALSEEKLAAALGVGRTPVREAFTALQRVGLINVQPQKGSFVFLPSEADVAALCEFRELMEIQALSLCCLRSKDALLSGLKKACENMDAAELSSDFLAVTRADGEFHNALFENCRNPYLMNTYELVSGQVAALRVRTTIVVGAANEHRPIIDALEMNDLARTKQLLSKHVLKVRALYLSAVQSRDFRSAGDVAHLRLSD